jgi:predicted nucleotidyltransferase
MSSSDDLAKLSTALAGTPELAFAILIGSRAAGNARPDSDWDIAVRWSPSPDLMHHLGRHEILRQRLAEQLDLQSDKIDLIDLASARLAMRTEVANAGKPLCIRDPLAWAYFQTSTWRQLEDFHWDRAHAA